MTYAFKNNESFFNRNRIDSLGHNGKWNSMLLDQLGNPVTTYYATSLGDLAIARLDEDGWYKEYIDQSGFANNQGFYPFIQKISSDSFYISFQSQNQEGKIRFASGKFGSWTVEDVLTLSGWTTYTTPSPLGVDLKGTPYIAYYDFAPIRSAERFYGT